MTTIGTLLSGGELVSVGARQVGVDHLWGFEIDDKIAQVARDNGFGVTTADVMALDPHTLEVPDILHTSPVCKRASSANQSTELNEDGTKEAPEDIAMGEKIAQFIDVMTPGIFTLENVFAYRNFKAFKIICAALNRNGYMWDFDNLNAADFGVPQTRRRLILRAKRGALLPNLPQPVRWVGWYDSIIDIMDSLPIAWHGNTKQPCEWDPMGRPCRKTGGLCRGHFARWQELRLPEEIKQALLVDSAGYPDESGARVAVTRQAVEPTNTIVANYERRPMRAFIVGTNANDSSGAKIYQEASEPIQTIRTPGGGQELRAWLVADEYGSPKNDNRQERILFLRDEQEPAMAVKAQTKATVRALLVSGGNSFQPVLNGDAPSVKLGASPSTNLHHRAWLSQGRVVAMTPRALARFQSVPDWYRFSGNKKVDVTIIGNGVPCKLYQVIIEGLNEPLR